MDKGQLGYIQSQKRKSTRNIILMLLPMILMWIGRFYANELVNRYLTLIIGISIIPLGLIITKFFMFVRFKVYGEKELQLSQKHIDNDRYLFDIILTYNKGTYQIPMVYIENNQINIFSKDQKLRAEIIKSLFKDKGYTIKAEVYNEIKMFYKTPLEEITNKNLENYRNIILNNSI